MAVTWFKGDVPTAVNTAKTQQASLMIFITSDDEYTLLYEKVLKSLDFSKKKYIAVKIVAYTEEYEQLKSIYRIVPVPSILVIDWETGLVMERISGAIFDEELQEALLDAIGDLPENQPISPETGEENKKDDESISSKQVKIQFKIPSGETKTQIYQPDDLLSYLRKDAGEIFKFNSFTLAIPYPRRILTPDDDLRSLIELSLIPASTILVLPNHDVSMTPWSLLDPFWRLINIVSNYFQGLYQRFFPPLNENPREDKKDK